MDPNVTKSRTEAWTNEKHLRFLNSMEASFVSTMLESNNRFLPLDRYLPDSSESTMDLKSQRRKKQPCSEIVCTRTRIMDERAEKRTRRISSQLYDPSEDQVVPQTGNRTGDKDERDSPNVTIAPVTPVN
ncbi:hypothetical protein K2173_008623 [Erythroxylum novogranatense]|uniref:Uncharacterized protein n=1 Tax=Erythroxylum novogranatense TaxID=1862640 RepID=A0AAV8SLF3_9ROSI|nr:hypothetical protein K2173_008623 [Erythroxylum novogranatense]